MFCIYVASGHVLNKIFKTHRNVFLIYILLIHSIVYEL